MDKNYSSLDIIRNYIPSLPKKDADLAYKFLDNRDFESLQMLVDSAIIRVKRGLSKENPSKEYLCANLDGIRRLKLEVDYYYSSIEPPNIN